MLEDLCYRRSTGYLYIYMYLSKDLRFGLVKDNLNILSHLYKFYKINGSLYMKEYSSHNIL